MTMRTFSMLCVFLYAINMCEAYKILIVFPTSGTSHLILADGIISHLLKAGHEVTYITTIPKPANPHPSLKEIDISALNALIPEEIYSIDKLLKKEIDLQGVPSLVSIFHETEIACLENENVTRFLRDPAEHFDVVLLEWLFTDLISGISAVFNCPYIWVSTLDPHWMVLKLIDEITNPAYTSGSTSNISPPLTFPQRAYELLQIVLGLGVQFRVSGSKQREYERLLAPIIRERGHSVPNFEDVNYNASLILGNSHASIGQATRLPQNYKAVGGFHIDTNNTSLTENLKKLLDDAKHGLIYFSLGTLAKSKYMPTELKVSLLKMFGKLKQTVLWKFEDSLPNRPNNVHIVQWAPQQNILAHPNCILFITHGGLLSTTEAVHFGKPLIGIPLFGDQFNNIDKSVKRGFAKRVALSYSMADELEEAIQDMLANSSYSTKVRALSAIYHDRLVPPGKELVYWVEFVVRTGGAPHLRSPALTMPWYQKCYLDLALLCTAILWTMVQVIKLLISNFPNLQRKQKIY